MASRVSALLLLGLVCIWFAAAEVPVNCCLEVSPKRIPLSIIERYFIQHAGQGCAIGATAFITRKGKTLCISHPDDESWVRGYIKYLEKKVAENKV